MIDSGPHGILPATEEKIRQQLNQTVSRSPCGADCGGPDTIAFMSKRVLIVLAIIVVVITTGMVLTMKRAFRADAIARDPDATPAKTQPAKP